MVEFQNFNENQDDSNYFCAILIFNMVMKKVLIFQLNFTC